MAYNISTTDGSVNFVISDNNIDTSTLPIALLGPNSSNYGDDLNRNAIKLLENFASTTSPTAQGYTRTLIGQLWFDKSDNILKVYKDTDADGNGDAWVGLQPYVSSSEPVSKKQGELWFNTANQKLYVHNGSQFVDAGNQQTEVLNTFSTNAFVSNPTLFGTKLRTIFLKDVTGKPHAVLGLVHVNNSTSNPSYSGSTNGETLMALLNHDEAFTVGNVPSDSFGEEINYYQELSAVNGIGVSIKKGLNLRQEYTQGAVPLADEATTAQTANAVYSSSLTVALTTDDDLFHDRKDVVPDTTNLYKLGDNSKLWNLGYINQLFVGSGSGSGGILPVGAAGAGVTIGDSTSGNAFQRLHVIDAYANGNVVVGNASTNGSITVYNGVNTRNITANGESNFGIISNVTITGGVNNQSITTDGAGNLSYATRLSAVTTTAGQGLSGGGTVTASGTTTTGTTTINVGQGYGISVSANEVAVNNTQIQAQANIAISNNTTDNLTEGTTNLYYTNARANAAIANVFASDVTLSQDLTVSGDLFVNGTQTILNTATLNVEDLNITVGNAATSSAAADGSGITFGNYSGNATLTWSHGSSRLQVNKPFYTSGGFVGNLTGDVTGAVTGTVSSLSNHDTGNLTEGSNLYYTDGRVDARIAVAQLSDLANVTYSSPSANTVLTWNGSNWIAQAQASGITELVNLFDVNGGASASTGQVLSKLANGEFGFGTVSSTNNYLTGLSFNTTTGILTATRSGLSDVTVDLDGKYFPYTALTSGTGISVSGATITNTAPDQTVSLTGSGATSVSGTYPNFTINSTDTNTTYTSSDFTVTSLSGYPGGTSQFLRADGSFATPPDNQGVTSVAAGTGLSGGTITTTGTISLSTAGIGAGTYGNTGNGTKIDTITVDAYGRITAVATGPTGTVTSDTNYYTNSASFNTSTGVISFSGAGGQPGYSVDIDGRFLTSETYTGTVTSVSGQNGISGTVTTSGSLTLDSDLRSHVYYIGQDTNDYIHVNTTVIDFYLDGALDMRLENDGDLHVDGDVVAFSGTTSDERLKENITPIENALTKIYNMRGVEFDWSATSRKGQHDIGVIAQEVEDIIPEVVREKELSVGEFADNPQTFKVVDYDKLSAVLIEAIKEQQDLINNLQKQIDELKNASSK